MGGGRVRRPEFGVGRGIARLILSSRKDKEQRRVLRRKGKSGSFGEVRQKTM